MTQYDLAFPPSAAVTKATEAEGCQSPAVESVIIMGKTKELTKDEQLEKIRILKNVVIISIAFMFLFTSFNSMANLQSSINK